MGFPANRYKDIVSYYLQISLPSEDFARTICPAANTALVFRCSHSRPGAFLVGIPTSAREAEYIISGGDYFLVFFCLGMARALCPIPAMELRDRNISLSELLPLESEGFIERITLSKTFRARVHAFEEFLEERMRSSQEPPTQISHIIRLILAHSGYFKTQTLENRVSYTDRHIRRLFHEHVGVPPKLFIDMIRFQKTLRHLNIDPHQNLAGLASELGYSDQSHFIRQFKKFYGSTPTQFLREFHRGE